MSDIPEGWAEVPLASLITELKNGISTRPNIDPPGVPILRISAVRPGFVDLRDHRFLPNVADDYLLRDGDLLFTRYNGSLDLVGVCGVVGGVGSRRIAYPDKLMRARVRGGVVEPEYLQAFFSSPEARSRIMALAKSSAGQQGISGGSLKDELVRVSPLAEQLRIIAKIEGILSEVQRAAMRISHLAKLLGGAEAPEIPTGRIRQAILARAFAGQLVPTEADLARAEGRPYETAVELLARVRTEAGSDERVSHTRVKRQDAARTSPKRRTSHG